MSLQDELSSLGSIALFAGLTADELLHIASLLHRTGFPSGTNLFTVEQPGEVAYLILSGTIKVHVEQTDGSDVILAILGRGELVGEMSLVENIGRSATAVTMEETAVAWIDRQAFHSCLARMPTLSTNLLGILARRLRLANEQIQSLATQDVFGRVARQLLAFGRQRLAVDGDRAGVDRLQPVDRPAQRALAGPGRADDDDDLAAVHREVDLLEDVQRAEVLVDAREDDERVRQPSLLSPGMIDGRTLCPDPGRVAHATGRVPDRDPTVVPVERAGVLRGSAILRVPDSQEVRP